MEDRIVVVMQIMTWRRTIDTYSDSILYLDSHSTLFCILE
jgi:hypothetical protein